MKYENVIFHWIQYFKIEEIMGQERIIIQIITNNFTSHLYSIESQSLINLLFSLLLWLCFIINYYVFYFNCSTYFVQHQEKKGLLFWKRWVNVSENENNFGVPFPFALKRWNERVKFHYFFIDISETNSKIQIFEGTFLVGNFES